MKNLGGSYAWNEGVAVALKIILAVLMALSFSGCAYLMFYHPNTIEYQTPSAYGLAYQNVYFKSSDTTMLHGWFVPAAGNPSGTVIHFHGNAQNMTAHFSYVSWLPLRGFNLITGGTANQRGSLPGKGCTRIVWRP